MKRINIILLAMLSLIVLSCNKDDSSESSLNIEQTFWEGKYIRTTVGVTKEYYVKMTFKNEENKDPYNGSSYTIFDFNSEKEYTSIMHYSINNKIITLKDSGRELDGDWWVISNDKNQLTLQRNLESNLQNSKLIINRKKI